MELVYIHRYYFEQAGISTNTSLEDVCHHLTKNLFKHLNTSILPEYTGIYLATSNAGVKPSVDFWRSATEKGPGFVFPQTFPRTLANFPCCFFARTLYVHGPQYTLVGKADAMVAAIDHAYMDIITQQVDDALILGIDFDVPVEGNSQFAALLINRHKGAAALQKTTGTPGIQPDEYHRPSTYLKSIIESLEKNENVVFGNDREGYFGIS